MIKQLPKEHRFRKKFIIPAYIYFDKHDPNILTFLNSLVEKLNSFYEMGIHVPGSGDGDITVDVCYLLRRQICLNELPL